MQIYWSVAANGYPLAKAITLFQFIVCTFEVGF